MPLAWCILKTSKITRTNYRSIRRGARNCTLILINNKDEMIPRALQALNEAYSFSGVANLTFHFTHDAHGASFIFIIHRMLNKNKWCI